MRVLNFFEFGDVSASRWRWLQRSWAFFGLALFLATWRLWIPQYDFPQVPLLELGLALPGSTQWIALAVVVLTMAAILILSFRASRRADPWLFGGFVTAMAVLILTDQHRLQPWAYQWVIFAVVFTTMPIREENQRRGMALLRILALSIYVYSSLGKFDFQFLSTVGQQFLGVTVGFVGVSTDTWPWSTRLALAATFPLIELLLVVLLLAPKLRSLGVYAAVVMHSGLLLVLGPWGLAHQPGVLLWNLFFIVQAVLLFSGSAARRVVDVDFEKTTHSTSTSRSWLATSTMLAVLLLPLLEPIGGFDHWPSWGLYSPRNSRAIVEIHRAGVSDLPEHMRRHLKQAHPDARWLTLDIDQWSLATLAVPIYPQDRFQLGVAASMATEYDLDRTIRVRLLGMSNRFTGERQESILTGRQQILVARDKFRLNVRPAPRVTQPGFGGTGGAPD